MGAEEIREEALKRLRKHTHAYTSTHIQFHSEYTTKTRLCTEPASEMRRGVHSPFTAGGRRSHSLLAALTQHEVASTSWCSMRRLLACVTRTLAHHAACLSALFSRQQRQALLHPSNYNTEDKLLVCITLTSQLFHHVLLLLFHIFNGVLKGRFWSLSTFHLLLYRGYACDVAALAFSLNAKKT